MMVRGDHTDAGGINYVLAWKKKTVIVRDKQEFISLLRIIAGLFQNDADGKIYRDSVIG
jgi:hypothetical protein